MHITEKSKTNQKQNHVNIQKHTTFHHFFTTENTINFYNIYKRLSTKIKKKRTIFSYKNKQEKKIQML